MEQPRKVRLNFKMYVRAIIDVGSGEEGMVSCKVGDVVLVSPKEFDNVTKQFRGGTPWANEVVKRNDQTAARASGGQENTQADDAGDEGQADPDDPPAKSKAKKRAKRKPAAKRRATTGGEKAVE